MEFHPADVIIMIINIVVLFVLLRLILWKRINRFLSDRASRIGKEIDDATTIREKAESLRSDYDSRIAAIEDRGNKIIRESEAKAAAEAERIITEAKAEVRDMMQEADERIEMNKERALKEARADITRLATEMASEILDREVKDVDNVRIVDDFFSDT